jgi:hypothetical protein
MNWDDKLARKILEAVEAFKPSENRNSYEDVLVKGYDSELVAYHVKGLCDQGSIRSIDVTSMGDLGPRHIVMGLAPAGHTQLDEYRKKKWLGPLGSLALKALWLVAAFVFGIVYRERLAEWLRAILP